MPEPGPLRLGVNIDHVATIRNARGGEHPDPARAAALVRAAGGEGITFHLREDRRHIRDDDLVRIREAAGGLPLNFEMAATDEMISIAERFAPDAACLVPERREERTTEGGLDAAGGHDRLVGPVDRLREAGARVSLFIEPAHEQIAAAKSLGAPVVELHTGRYGELFLSGDDAACQSELQRLREAAAYASGLGLEAHAGHGLSFDNVAPVAAIREVVELNIGHFLIGEAVFTGLEAAIARMRELMDEARA
ncbi:MAG: pyridoxine 5'-phosphate synthase [Alphaproteobacteria bacterium]|nr:pyridoxine 5'-phosphate synthase [Alphaproteobacteria bacterium]